MRPLVKYWRSQGLQAVVYLDDGIGASCGELKARKDSSRIQQDLDRAGFVANIAKCKWSPSQQCVWLGFEVDLHQDILSVPQEKINALKTQLEQVALRPRLLAKVLASLAGKIIAMSIALGPVARLMTRGLFALLSTRQSWCETLTVSDQMFNFGLQRWSSLMARTYGWVPQP